MEKIGVRRENNKKKEFLSTGFRRTSIVTGPSRHKIKEIENRFSPLIKVFIIKFK